MTAQERVAQACLILDAGLLGAAGPRAASFLLRMALEELVEGCVTSLDPRIRAEGVPFRVVLLCLLRLHPDRDVGARASAAWNGLSRACHAHRNELPPPEDAVRAWIASVEDLGPALAPPGVKRLGWVRPADRSGGDRGV